MVGEAHFFEPLGLIPKSERTTKSGFQLSGNRVENCSHEWSLGKSERGCSPEKSKRIASVSVPRSQGEKVGDAGPKRQRDMGHLWEVRKKTLLNYSNLILQCCSG